MGELRRGDTTRGLQSNSIHIRGNVYKNLRVTAGTARIASRTSGKALRTTGNFAMNRIKSALLSGDRSEALKYMSEEEVKRWDSLSTFQKRKIIRQAERYADQVTARGTEIAERPKILAGKMNKLTKEKLPYRYEVETYAGNTAAEMRHSMKMQKRMMKEQYKQKLAGTGMNGTLSSGQMQENVPRQDAGIIPDFKPAGPEMSLSAGRNSLSNEMPALTQTPAANGSQLRTAASPSYGISHSARRRLKKSGSKYEGQYITSTVFYASNERRGNRKAVKIEKKFKKAVAKENRRKAAAFLGTVLATVNKDTDRKKRREDQYRAQAITIDQYMSGRNGSLRKTALLPARVAGKMVLRKIGNKLAEILVKLIPPFVKQLFAGLVAVVILLSMFIFLINILLSVGSQSRQADLGLWRLTGYCPCVACSGPWGNSTASGVTAVEGRTVAIHETTMEAFGLQFGDKLLIRDHIYTLEDHGGSEMGGSNGGKCVDIYVEEHADCYRDELNGYANVYLVSDDGSLSLIGGGSGDGLVAYAEQFVGCPYVWGGSSLTEGCDCSHFVWLCLMNCGLYNGEYLVSNDWAYVGTPVNSLAEARAGDIVVYNGHVAIYDGAGMIVEAKGSAWGITHDRNVTCKPIVAIRRFT